MNASLYLIVACMLIVSMYTHVLLSTELLSCHYVGVWVDLLPRFSWCWPRRGCRVLHGKAASADPWGRRWMELALPGGQEEEGFSARQLSHGKIFFNFPLVSLPPRP